MMPRRDDPLEQLLPRLRAWRRHNIHLGVVPRASAFWSGLLCREPRGAVAEYARVFDTAMLPCLCRCADDRALLSRMNAQAGEGFAWTLPVDDERMVYRFPHGHPEWKKRGEVNPRFLDPAGMRETLAPLLRLLEPSACVVMLKIVRVERTEALEFGAFLGALTRFLDALPPSCRCAVENGTPRFILPDYLACLRERNVIHVPAAGPLLDAVRTPGALGADACLLRTACLAAEEEGEEWAAFRGAVRLCLEEGKALYAYLTGGEEGALPPALRGEGAPRLARLLAGLDPDLALRSPIRRKAA